MINKYPFCFVIDVYSISLHKKEIWNIHLGINEQINTIIKI